MPQTTPFLGARIPLEVGEAGNVPADLWRYALDIDDRHNLVCASQAERDSIYSTVRTGAVVHCPALRTGWVKLDDAGSSAQWMLLYRRPDAVTTGVVATSDPSFSVDSQWAQISDQDLKLKLAITYGGATTLTAQAVGDPGGRPGDLVDTLMVTLAAPYRPVTDWYPNFLVTGGSAQGRIRQNGAVQLMAMATGGVLRSGDQVFISVDRLPLPLPSGVVA